MSDKTATLHTFFSAGLALMLCACGRNDIDTNPAKAKAEREAAAEHFGHGKYADVKPIGAEDSKQDTQKRTGEAHGNEARK